MEFDLYPGISLRSGTFNALIAPEELITDALNGSNEIQRFMFLAVSGNYSRLLSGITRRSTRFDVQRAFTAHQLHTIIAGAYHTVVLVEHDPTVYEGAEEMLEIVSHALKELAHNALVILYAQKPDLSFEALCRHADRVFFINAPLVPAHRGGRHRSGRASSSVAPPPPRQMTLEGV